MLKAIAVDDEPMALEVIKSLSEFAVNIVLLECFTDPFAAMKYIQDNQVELVFLDIKMPAISGIDFIKSLANPPLIILTTAYREYALEGFDNDVVDYIMKPFSLARFLKACNKATDLFNQRKNLNADQGVSHIFIKSGYEKVKIELRDILYLECIGNYVRFILSDRTIVSRHTMNEAESLLPSGKFVRINRSNIINKNYVTKLDKRSVWLDGLELSIGNAFVNNINDLIK